MPLHIGESSRFMKILKKTAQLWKLHLLIIGFALASVFMIYGFLNIKNLTSETFFYYVIGGVCLGSCSFLFGVIAIKCPYCSDKWFWSALKDKKSYEWLIFLYSLDSCPKCGRCDQSDKKQ